MKSLLHALVLPAEITEFERTYLVRMNKVGLWFFALHVPIFVFFAWINHTGPLLAALMSTALFVGPVLAQRAFDNPRHVSMVLALTAMLMGGLLVHIGQGPVQIEMHFYFFALIAMLAVYANPLVILTAAVTVAVHHLAVWAVLPQSVFNYAAPFWVVAVHAAFVVVESVATCFIARSFFDNVIGLERIVRARTAALDERNRDMRLVLDNVSQGFLTIDRAGLISPEKSAVVSQWFGAVGADTTFVDCVARKSPEFAEQFAWAWTEVVEGIMPLALTLHQLPKRLSFEGRHFQVDVASIGEQDPVERVLIVITDATADVERARLAAEQCDVFAIMEHVARDKSSVFEFFAEAYQLMRVINEPDDGDLVRLKRAVHTLKGNALLFGVQTVGEYCHELENRIAETNIAPSPEERGLLQARFDRVCKSTALFLGDTKSTKLEVEDSEFDATLSELMAGTPRADVMRRMQAWKHEPTALRLARVADQAKGLARRLNKGSITVEVAAGDISLDPVLWSPFWASFVHVVRNAVDHGLEDPDTRASHGKARRGAIRFTTRSEPDAFVIEVRDDGRGVDWERVRRRAREHGLPAATHEELVEALFADGVSTRDDVSDTSGRGVGMGAVRQACRERGGEVSITSIDASGTTIVFRFPSAGPANDVLLPKGSVAS